MTCLPRRAARARSDRAVRAPANGGSGVLTDVSEDLGGVSRCVGAVGNNHDEGLLFLCLRPVLASPPETASSPRAYRPRTRFASASDTRGTAPRSTRRRRSGPTAGCPSPPRACARGPPLARTLAIDRGLAPRTSPWWTRARERPAWTARPSPVAHPPTRSTPSIRSTPSALSPPRATELCRRHFVDDPFFLGDRRVQVRLFRFSRARFRPCFLSRGEKRGLKISPRKWMRSRPSWRWARRLECGDCLECSRIILWRRGEGRPLSVAGVPRPNTYTPR